MDPARTLIPTPAGVIASLGQAEASVERLLFEHILRAGHPVPIDMRGFAAALGRPVADVARALFALHRQQRLSVLEQAPPVRASWAATGLAGLVDDLLALATPGQCLLLSSADGFCLARVGWTTYEAEVLAARTAPPRHPTSDVLVSLHVGARTFRLSANAPIDTHHTALLQLGHRLLHSCGPFEDTGVTAC